MLQHIEQAKPQKQDFNPRSRVGRDVFMEGFIQLQAQVVRSGRQLKIQLLA